MGTAVLSMILKDCLFYRKMGCLTHMLSKIVSGFLIRICNNI